MVLGHNCVPHVDMQLANLSRQRVIAAHLSPLCLSACCCLHATLHSISVADICMRHLYQRFDMLLQVGRCWQILDRLFSYRVSSGSRYIIPCTGTESKHVLSSSYKLSCFDYSFWDLFDHAFTPQLAYCTCMSNDIYLIANFIYIYFAAENNRWCSLDRACCCGSSWGNCFRI